MHRTVKAGGLPGERQSSSQPGNSVPGTPKDKASKADRPRLHGGVALTLPVAEQPDDIPSQESGAPSQPRLLSPRRRLDSPSASARSHERLPPPPASPYERSTTSGSQTSSRALGTPLGSPNSSAGWAPSSRDPVTFRVRRPPRWRQNLQQLREEFDIEAESVLALSYQHRGTRSAPLWRQAFALACEPLTRAVFQSIVLQTRDLEMATLSQLLQKNKNRAEWDSFARQIAIPACAHFFPAPSPHGRKTWSENNRQRWALDMQATVLKAIPVEIRIMLGELIDEYRKSREYQHIVDTGAPDAGKRHMNQKVVDTLIFSGLRDGLTNPAPVQHAALASQAAQPGGKPAPPPEPDSNLKALHALFLRYLATACAGALTGQGLAGTPDPAIDIDQTMAERAHNFVAILLEDACRRARGRSVRLTIKNSTEQHKQQVEKTIADVLARAANNLAEPMAGSDSENDDLQAKTEDSKKNPPATWRGTRYPFLASAFVERFDDIRLERLVDEVLKFELRTPDEFIRYVVRDYRPDEPLGNKNRQLLYLISDLVAGGIEEFVRSTYFNHQFPLTTSESGMVQPSRGSLSGMYRLEWHEDKLCLRYCLLSQDVADVTVVPDTLVGLCSPEDKLTESAAPFKLTGRVWFTGKEKLVFENPKINAMNFNVLLNVPGSPSSPGQDKDHIGSTSGRGSISRLGKSFRSSFRFSSSKGEDDSSTRREPDTPTKLGGRSTPTQKSETS